jgi:fungal STAND N-terminal Goodbye domain
MSQQYRIVPSTLITRSPSVLLLPLSSHQKYSSIIANIPSISDMSDLSSSMLQPLFDTALRDYEKQTGMKLIEHPLARQLENCNSVESIIALLQEQARAFTEFRREDDKVMKPLKRVVHVLHAISTNLVRRVTLLNLFLQTLLL